MAGAGGTIPLGSLNVEQLEGIQQTTDQEVQYLSESLRQLNSAMQRLSASRKCAKDLPAIPEQREIMVPLTSSVYVPGHLQSTSTVLVDLGTGYYVEKTPVEAEAYFTRRINLVRDQMDKATNALNQKRQMLEAVMSVLQRKRMQMQQQGAPLTSASA
eukprot:Plantae.Rhodophyta-Purpureofilum_apyrenoidigerum.ctg1841.p1 GENE.Plantae.Rhodophyta-Purpureofilum_apyrenoidigerum.ctg1841~~Plantae.Rhodophyta-Purpureofilum_apyrenoidigerum.ctg1841.p1  ORF type:complete len:158 (-),score=30.13 Plantae.Rhodophyta-Purpureofilum_apyrenoidigerum.ctg1841:1343-1816(-)